MSTKAKLLQEGIFFSYIYLPETFYYWKSWKSKKLRPPSIQLLKTDIIKLGLVFPISNFFINTMPLANKWMSFSCSNSALCKDRFAAFNLTRLRWILVWKLSQIWIGKFVLDQQLKILSDQLILGLCKGQTISKANYGILNCPKKRTLG